MPLCCKGLKLQHQALSMHYYFTLFESLFTKNTQKRILKHMMELDISQLRRFSTGDTISRVNDDVKAMENFMAVQLSNLIKNYVVSIVGLGVLFYLSVPLTLAALPLLILVPLSMDLVKKKVRIASDNIRYSNGKVVSTIEQTLSGLYIINAHSYQSLFTDEYEKNANRIIDNRKKMVLYQSYSGAIAEIVIAMIMFGIVYGFGAHLVFQGKFTTGGIVAYYTYIGMMLGPLVSIFKTKLTVQSVLSSFHRIEELLLIGAEDKDHISSEKLSVSDSAWQKIVFNDVHFKYEEDIVLDGISLEIDRGEKVAFVGANGSGKSTLISLLLGLELSYKGEISFDDLELRRISNLKKLLSVVPQEAYLFNKTVLDNLTLDLEIDEKSVSESLKLLNIDYIDNLQMEIKDRGNSLSGGERQRLCIARALVRNTPVLVLDELSNNLDAASESHIYSLLKSKYEDRTIIVATHRMSAIKDFDKIYLLQNGRILDRGTFSELSERNLGFNCMV